MNIINRIKQYIFNYLIAHYDYTFRQYYDKNQTTKNVTRPYQLVLSENCRFKDKIVVVTGGSGAIGRACCLRFALEGAKVYVCGRNQKKSDSIVAEIVSLGGIAKSQSLDVTNADDVKCVLKAIGEENNGHIDFLINSAGGSAREKSNMLANIDVDVIDEILDVNLRGAMLCAKYVIPYMQPACYGRIINITSVIGLQGKASFSDYAASKGGSIAFVKSLAQELGIYGITVNGVAPGIVQRGNITTEIEERLKKTNWLNSYCTPEDIANAVVFLCSDEASFITGQNLCVDGGRCLGLKEI